jgi:hypothetical protein
MGDLRSSSVSFSARKNIYDNTKNEKAKDDITASDLSVEVATALAKHLFARIKNQQNTPGYQHLLDKINTLKDNIILHGVHKNSNNNYEIIVYQLTHQLSDLSQSSIKLFLRTQLPQLLQNLNLSNLVESNTADAQIANKLIQESKNHINLLKSKETQPKTVEENQKYAMAESSQTTSRSSNLDSDHNVIVTDVNSPVKKNLEKQQQNIIDTIKQKLNKYHNLVSIYSILQRIKDKLSYSYSYNVSSQTSKLKGLIVAPNISNDDFNAIINYFAAIKPDLIANLKRLHALGKSANRQLLNTLIGLITTEQGSLQAQEHTLVKNLAENNVELSNIHNQLTAKGLKNKIVNLPPDTKIPTTAKDTLKQQQQHDLILQYKNSYIVDTNKLSEFNEVLSLLTSLQQLQGSDSNKNSLLTSKLTELQQLLLQEQGIDVNSLATNLNSAINNINTVISTLNSNANKTLTDLKNSSALNSTVKSTTIRNILTEAQGTVLNKIAVHDSNVTTLVDSKIRRLNRILALVYSKNEDENLAKQQNLGYINKHLPLTKNDIEFLVALNGGKQADVIKNIIQSKDYNKFNDAVKVIEQIKNNLAIEYQIEYTSRIQQHSALTNIQQSLTANGFSKDINQIADVTKQNYIDKLNTEKQTLQQTQKIAAESDEKQKLAAFVATLTAAKNANMPFNLNFLNPETLFLLNKYHIISGSNYFTDPAVTNGKSDFDLIEQADSQLQKDSSYKPGEVKFPVSDYQQLIDKITPVLKKIQSDETADLSALTTTTKQNVINNLLSILTSKQKTLDDSTKTTSNILDDTLEASGAITQALKQSTDTTTASGAFHKLANDIKHPQLVAVHVDSDLTSRLKTSYFSQESEQLKTPQKGSTLQTIQTGLTSYKDSLLAQQNRYYYNLLQTNDELTAINKYLPKSSATTEKTSYQTKESLYTPTLYSEKQTGYTVYADHKDKLHSIKTVADFLYYLNTLKGNLSSNNNDSVVIDPKYFTPEIIFLLSTKGNFKPGNNFLQNTNPDDIPASLRDMNWTDFNLLAYNNMQPPIGKKLNLTAKKLTTEQLTGLINALYTIKTSVVNSSLKDVTNIKNPNIATVALKEHMSQLQLDINNNQDNRKDIVEKIHHLQRIMWKAFSKIDNVDEDSTTFFSKTKVADKLGLKFKLDLLSKEDIQWLSSAIDPKIIEQAMKSHKPADLIVLKQKINAVWGNLQTTQKRLEAAIKHDTKYEYDPINKYVKDKFDNQGIMVKIDTTDYYNADYQTADLKTQSPYEAAEKYSQMIFRLTVFNTWLISKIYRRKDTDTVNFSPRQLSPELFKDLSFKNNNTDESILEKSGFDPETTRFLKEPTTMEDGSKLNIDLYPDQISTKGMQRDFYFVTNNKLTTDYSKKFSLIGTSWKISDLKLLSSNIEDSIQQLNALESKNLQELHKENSVLLQPSLRKKALILEYDHLVTKLNKAVNKIDELNNEKSSFSEIKMKIGKIYNEYQLHKDNPYNKYVEIPSIKLGFAKLIMAALELNKKYLADHHITNLPTKAEDIVNLNKIANKDKVLESLSQASNLLANKNLTDLTNLIDKQNKIIKSIAEIAEKLKELGFLEYGFGPISLTGGQFAVTVFRQQYANATNSREKDNEKANRYLDDNKLLNHFHQIITNMLPAYFKDTKVSADGFSSKPRQLPVDQILALKTPRIADMLHSFLTLVSKTNIAKNQATRVLPKGKNLFKMPTHLRSGKKIDSLLQQKLEARIKKDHGNIDYSLIAYNLDHPDDPLELETEEFTRAEAQAMSGTLGVIEKTLGDQAQLQLAKVQQDELHINNAVEVQIQFIKSYNKACLRLLSAMN